MKRTYYENLIKRFQTSGVYRLGDKKVFVDHLELAPDGLAETAGHWTANDQGGSSGGSVTISSAGNFALAVDNSDNTSVAIEPSTASLSALTGWNDGTNIGWIPDGRLAEIEFTVKTGADAGASQASETITVGLTSTSITGGWHTDATADDAVIRDKGGIWSFQIAKGGADTDFDSAVAVAASTTYKFLFRYHADKTVSAFVNGTFMGTSAAFDGDEALTPIIGLRDTDAVARELEVISVSGWYMASA